MKRYQITIDGRKFSAVFNLTVMEAIADRAREDGKVDPGKPVDVDMIMRIGSSPYGLVNALVDMIREGEALDGRDASDVDLAWMKAHLSPGQGVWLQRKALAIMTEGMTMETEDEDVGEVDTVLEQIKKKETKGS